MSGMKTAVLLAALAGLLILAGGAIGGQNGMLVAFVIAVVMNFTSYWFSDTIVLKMHRATEVGEEHVLFRVTRRLAQKANLPMPRVYIIPQQAPNAFATGRDPKHAAVAATEGLLRMLSEPELEGVIAHELAHVKNRDILISSVAATIAAAIMLLANFARFAAMFGGGSRSDGRGQNPLAILAMAILAPLAAAVIQATISRQREFGADRGGAEIVGSPMGLVNALRKLDSANRQIPMDTNPAAAHMYIMKPFSARALGNLFSTHPPTEERIEALLHR